MLQDGVFVREDWIADGKHQDIAVRFLRASFRGWIFCHGNFEECVDIVLKNGPTLGKGHRTWMLNEINALVQPSPNGIGLMDRSAFERTAQIRHDDQIITTKPDTGTYCTDLAYKALEALNNQGLDSGGLDFKKRVVRVTKGGE